MRSSLLLRKVLLAGIFVPLSMSAQEQINSNAKWNVRGPIGRSDKMERATFDKRDENQKKVWLSTWAGLWYCEDITQDFPHWALKFKGIGSYSFVQHPVFHDYFFANGPQGLVKTYNAGGNWIPLFKNSSLSGDLKISNTGELYIFRENSFYARSNTVERYDYVEESYHTIFDPLIDSPEEANIRLSDLDIDAEGKIYVSMENGKILRSDNPYGGPWTSICPYSDNTTNGQTELSVISDDHGQINLIAFHTDYNKPLSQRTQWFKKSTDGGVTWQNVVVRDSVGNNLVMCDQYKSDITFGSSPDKILISGYLATAASSDGGITWKYIANTEHTGQGGVLAVSDDNRLLSVDYWDFNYISSPFTIGTDSSTSGEGDLTTYSIKDFLFINKYSNTNYVIDNVIYTGDSLLRKGSKELYYDQIINDQDEPSKVLMFRSGYFNPDTLWVLDTNFKVTDRYVDYNLTGTFDSKATKIYRMESNSSYNNSPRVVTISGFGEENLTKKYYSLPSEDTEYFNTVVANDTILYQYKSDWQYQTLRKIILHQNGLAEKKILFNANNTVINKIKVMRENADIVILQKNSGLYLSIDGGENWTPRISNDITYNFEVNPHNFNHVFYTSNSKVYFTENFLSGNPIWKSFSDININGIKSDQIWFREADGELFIQLSSAGLYSANIYGPTLLDTLIISQKPFHLSPNEPFKLSFYRNGSVAKNNTYELWLSDSSGSFVHSTKIGSSNESPIYGCIPLNTLSGEHYRLQLLSINPTNHTTVETISQNLRISDVSFFIHGFNDSGERSIINQNTLISDEFIWGTSRTNYKAWNEVLLKPGFISLPSNGGYFKAEITGCTN